MRRICLVAIGFALAMWALPNEAHAISVTCPHPDNTPTGATNTYTVNSALDCVYGGFPPNASNINGGKNDAFLKGEGTNESEYDPAGFSEDPTFGLTWTTVCSSGTVTGTCTGVTFTVASGNQSGTYSISDSNYLYYALGIKDGDAPQWAVFLLDSLSGVMTMTGGSFSHFVLYGSGTPTTTTGPTTTGPTTTGPTTTDISIPEPASLLLLGLGFVAASYRLRRRGQTR